MKPVLKGMALDDLHTPPKHQSPNNDFNHLAPPRLVTLRSLSKSETHLDVPHLIVSQDEEHPSLNRVLSSLFQADSALRTPVSSNSNLAANTDPRIQPSASSAALLTSESQPTTGVLRKSSSAINWAQVLVGERKISQQQFAPFVPSPPIGESPHGQPSLVVAERLEQLQQHHHTGGLVMSSSSDRKQSQVMPSSYSQQLSTASASVAASTPSSSVQAASLPPNASAPNLVVASGVEKPHAEHHGYFGSMFHRGFFAKPVIRSDEENYRYLMALDR